MPSSHEPTIADVAKAAGVSVSTVSRILNNKQDVSPETRKRVQQVIDSLGYSPSVQAQGLASGRSGHIAMICPNPYDGYDPINMEFIVGAATAAGDHNFVFRLMTKDVTTADLLRLYRSSEVDAVILMQIYLTDWRVELLREHGYPFAMIGLCASHSGLNFIDLDFELATRAAFDYLYGLGHRQIAFLGLPKALEASGYGPAIRSWRAYQKIVQSFDGLISVSRETGLLGKTTYNATLELIDEMPNLTAIVTPHSNPTHNIILALRERGRRVPQDCSVIAITSSNIAEACVPAMTTIDFPAYMMGYHAMEVLAQRLQQEDIVPEQKIVYPEVVVRESTGPARQRS